jgi:hypothetical protein
VTFRVTFLVSCLQKLGRPSTPARRRPEERATMALSRALLRRLSVAMPEGRREPLIDRAGGGRPVLPGVSRRRDGRAER